MNRVLLTLLLLYGSAGAAADGSRDWLTEVVNLQEKLRVEFGSHPVTSLNEADLYIETMARLESAVASLRDDPLHAAGADMFTVCSLYAAAARVQLEVRLVKQAVTTLHTQNDSILSALNRVHQDITAEERQYGTRLKADLARQRRDARKQADAAAGRMEELRAEAEKARAEADRIRADAEERFNALRSELIKVSRDARGTIISMSDILFAVDSADLTSDLQTSLAKIAGILLVYKTPPVVVEGHTDNTGTASYNQKLSERRADAVMQFLTLQGVAPGRLSAVGYGLTKPVADNTTDEGRSRNRRVDLVIQDAVPE